MLWELHKFVIAEINCEYLKLAIRKQVEFTVHGSQTVSHVFYLKACCIYEIYFIP